MAATLDVSIHAPAWGATILLLRTSPVVLGFNPRTRVGCDILEIIPEQPCRNVSIHAPAWGATTSC